MLHNPRHLLMILLSAVMLLTAACSGSPTIPAPSDSIPVLVTVPVEVTRLVEIERTVEVTREVLLTQVVEVVITATPKPTEAVTSTPEPSPTPTLAPTSSFVYATATVPSEKTAGFAPLRVSNRSEARMDIIISGKVYKEFSLSSGNVWMEVIPEGEYSFSVKPEGSRAQTGVIRLTNPDKHELVIHPDRITFLVP